MSLTDQEKEGLKEVRRLRQEYLCGNKGNERVRQFVTDADDTMLLRYLIGRKYRAQYAWDTLRKNAEVRFERYPHIFPETLPPEVAALPSQENLAILKGLSFEGQRIMVWNASEWDPKLSLEQVGMAMVRMMDNLIKDDHCIKNGWIIVIQADGHGYRHARHYSPQVVLRMVNVMWHSYPIKYRVVYYVNAIYVLKCIISLIRPFLPAKLSKRLILSSESSGYQEVFQHVSPEILPKAFGGTLEFGDAIDPNLSDIGS